MTIVEQDGVAKVYDASRNIYIRYNLSIHNDYAKNILDRDGEEITANTTPDENNIVRSFVICDKCFALVERNADSTKVRKHEMSIDRHDEKENLYLFNLNGEVLLNFRELYYAGENAKVKNISIEFRSECIEITQVVERKDQTVVRTYEIPYEDRHLELIKYLTDELVESDERDMD